MIRFNELHLDLDIESSRYIMECHVYILGFLDVKIVSKLMTVSAGACFRDFVLVVVIVMV